MAATSGDFPPAPDPLAQRLFSSLGRLGPTGGDEST